MVPVWDPGTEKDWVQRKESESSVGLVKNCASALVQWLHQMQHANVRCYNSRENCEGQVGISELSSQFYCQSKLF